MGSLISCVGFFFFSLSFFICALKTQNRKMRPESEEPAQPLGRILRGFGTKPQDSQVLSFSGSQWEAGFPAERKKAGHGGVRAVPLLASHACPVSQGAQERDPRFEEGRPVSELLGGEPCLPW